MNPESLEGLLIDRHLGELPEEFARLLDAYLEKDADAARVSRALTQTLGLARRTLRATPGRALPRLRATMPNVRRFHSWQRLWDTPALRMAATLALGLFVGYVAAGLGRSDVAVSGSRETKPNPSLVLNMRDTAKPSATFWSRSRWASQLNPSTPRPARRTWRLSFAPPGNEL